MKRLIDFSIALVMLILSSPILLIVALLVRIKLGPGIFFRQTRPGVGCKPFEIIKFRTMLNLANKDGNSVPDEDRLTALGKFLRSTSLDELPELWNVLKGDMSLVGPRPLLMEYLSLYNEEQRSRQDVRPGITGWAQVNGRNAILWDEKFKLDVWYVNNQSFWLDMKIILLTIKKVLTRDDISANDHSTMPFFMGNQNEDDCQK